mgnify:FL=1|tara:strand:+ start:2505 stop:2699 length:195 start_codon:yes stop_codon:yes gene_type:complete
MNRHKAGMDYLLGIKNRDSSEIDNAILLTIALKALQQSTPVNGRAAELRRIARAEITAKLRRAA